MLKLSLLLFQIVIFTITIVGSLGEDLILADKFRISWKINSVLESFHLSDSFRISHFTKDINLENNIPVWETYPEHAFIRLGNASLPRPPILNGNYQLEESVEYLSDITTIDSIMMDKNKMSLNIDGKLLQTRSIEVAKYKLIFTVTHNNQLQFDMNIIPSTDIFIHNNQNILTNPRTFLTYSCISDENFYGFGESFSYFNLKGKIVPILVSEQGVGRGEQPITDYLNTNVSQGVGGTWYTTYAPKPIYITNYNRTFMLNNSEVSFFNLTATTGIGNNGRGKHYNML